MRPLGLLCGSVAIALSAAMFAAACGDDFTTGSATTTTSSSSSSTSTSTTTGEGGAGGTTTATGGGGGGGGVAECVDKTDCPGQDLACIKRTCLGGTCGTKPAPLGTKVDSQLQGDCKAAVCDGAGQITSDPDASDVFDDGNDCTMDACSGDTAVNPPLAMGTSCAGGKCDGAGHCVECNVNGDCDGGAVCSAHNCVDPSCLDQSKNGSETDVDCGGPDCAPCADGFDCVLPADCQSGVCDGGACQVPACDDAVHNGDETDVDCGSTCPKCKDDHSCVVDSDCLSDVCFGGLCQVPTCSDGHANGDESDVDCGGGCKPCPSGMSCKSDADCSEHWCVGATCTAHCADSQKNADESDVDCGGSGCPGCGLGASCGCNDDCGAAFVCCKGNVDPAFACRLSISCGSASVPCP